MHNFPLLYRGPREDGPGRELNLSASSLGSRAIRSHLPDVTASVSYVGPSPRARVFKVRIGLHSQGTKRLAFINLDLQLKGSRLKVHAFALYVAGYRLWCSKCTPARVLAVVVNAHRFGLHTGSGFCRGKTPNNTGSVFAAFCLPRHEMHQD